ncbi:Voltage-gated Ion Channel [Phytophthora megakarya]|uniref:Voltage-gated Ion Channel n=1 Tax=Phytophthora megakarya TaxID=4795 RepID=A0A225WWA5_9STRA|nr:Voltage-gated Ion Channel [Phytophthora megakarya]
MAEQDDNSDDEQERIDYIPALAAGYYSGYHIWLTLRRLRLLRIVSFLRLERMYNATKNLRVIFARRKEELLVVTYLKGVVLLTSSLLIIFLKHFVQPSVFSSFGVCVWWSVETITSLGYGDVVPITGLVLGSGFIEVMLEKQREEKVEMYSVAMGYTSTPAPAYMPISVTSSNSPHFAAMRMTALHQKVEAITAGQCHLETQFRQQQQLERLLQLVETALGVATDTASTNESEQVTLPS